MRQTASLRLEVALVFFAIMFTSISQKKKLGRGNVKALVNLSPFVYPIDVMSKTCIVTGKNSVMGFHVSHSKRHVKRRLHANVQKKRLLNPATGRMVRVSISTSGLRTLKKWAREGKKYDLTKM